MIGKCEIKDNVDLTKYNTYRIKSTASHMAFPKTIDELINLITLLETKKEPILILGNGSNVIISNSIYHGTIVNLTKLNKIIINKEKEEVYALAGAMLPQIAKKSIDESLNGLEWAIGIPGTLGGAIYGNAGAYLSCIFDLIKEVAVLHNKKIIYMSKDELTYDYRTSYFKSHKDYIIVGATLKLKKGSTQESLDLCESRRIRRANTQPLTYPSAGSVFKNPSKEMPAGKLIEESGLKGYQIGGAKISDLHANFIINNGGATAKDILKLIALVKKTIKEKYNIDLICEQEIIDWE